MGGCTYYTKQGDMWDYIAWVIYGDESYVSVLYRANPAYMTTYIFPDGCAIYCPEVEAEEEEDGETPDWRDQDDLEEDSLDGLSDEEGEEEEEE